MGCERGILCGYLHDQERLKDPQVACRISQVIGSRKLLLGSCAVRERNDSDSDGLDEFEDASIWAETGGIVAGMAGLFPALGLTDAPLLDVDELARLENAEDRALSLTLEKSTTPEHPECWFLLTKMIDRIHEHIVRNIVEHFHS